MLAKQRRGTPVSPPVFPSRGRHRIHPVNLSLGHGSSIQDVSGRGKSLELPPPSAILRDNAHRPAACRYGRPSGRRRRIRRRSPGPASPSRPGATYRSTSSRRPSAHSTGAIRTARCLQVFPAMPMPSGSGVETDAVPQFAEDMEHHVHVVATTPQTDSGVCGRQLHRAADQPATGSWLCLPVSCSCPSGR